MVESSCKFRVCVCGEGGGGLYYIKYFICMCVQIQYIYIDLLKVFSEYKNSLCLTKKYQF